MITTQEVKVQAQNPSMPLNPFTAFKGSPSSIRVLDVPKKIGLWNITSVQIQVTYPDSHIVSKECVRTGNVWVGTLEGTLSVGSVCKGYQITASGIDEDGNEISGYVLGVGDVVIMELNGSIYPSESADYIRIFDEQPTNPKKGDAYLDGIALMVYDGNTWTKVGGQNIPTKVSQLQNDKGYLTTVYWNDVKLKPTIPTKVSQLQNDSNFGDKWKIFSQDNNQYLNGDLEVYSMMSAWRCQDGVEREFEIYFDGMSYYWKATWTTEMGSHETAYSDAFSSMEQAENADSIFLHYYGTEIWCYKAMQYVKQDDVATQNYVNQQIGNVLTQEEF